MFSLFVLSRWDAELFCRFLQVYKHDHLDPNQIAAIKEEFDKHDKQEIDAIPALELINVLRLLQLTPTQPDVTEVGT